jgi:GTP-binding protein EngB required for normal cell division
MNQYHRRRIAATFRHIDGRLAEIEAILQAVGSQSPFSAYALDIEPMARHTVASYLQRLREKMWTAMQDLDISETGHRTGAAWAISCDLTGVMVDLADMEPQRLVGFGQLHPEAVKKIAGICADLQRLCSSAQAYLSRSRGEDLAQRLARLTAAPDDRNALAKLEGMITRHGLVELRPMLESIVERLESADLEVAFFGRVSSGKSSLLNHLLGEEILPVGVLPVTAVLTRLRRAEVSDLVVRFEISQPQRLPLDQIAEFVTEEGNPGNRKQVTEVQVRLANPRLAEGVAFMDTPGVGSLATLGAAQTKAYLPRCDLGILLIDAGSSMDHEDIALLRGFFDAAIPAMILISKADLLNAADRHRVRDYVSEQVRNELGSEIPVYPVSTRVPEAAMADHWFREAIGPLTQRHRELAAQSIRRKTAHLAELVVSYLEAMIGRSEATTSLEASLDTPQIEAVLAEADNRIAAVASSLAQPVEAGLSGSVERIIEQAAKHAVAAARKGVACPEALIAATAAEMAEAADGIRRRLEELARTLEQTLRKVSHACGGPDNLSLDETIAGFTPLPRADERRLSEIPQMRCSRMISWWPGLALRLVRRRMMHRGELPIWSALRDHRDRVQTWLKENLENTSNAYEAYVALFRDQLRHVGEGRVGFQDTEQVQADLGILREMAPVCAVSPHTGASSKSECGRP